MCELWERFAAPANPESALITTNGYRLLMDADLPPVPANHPVWSSPDLIRAVRGDRPGTVVSLVRKAAGLTQAQLGQRCGYSASAVSRLEHGQPPLHDIGVRRRLAAALGIPGRMLGLAGSSPGHDRVGTGRPRPPTATLRPGEGGDPMKRRIFLA